MIYDGYSTEHSKKHKKKLLNNNINTVQVGSDPACAHQQRSIMTRRTAKNIGENIGIAFMCLGIILLWSPLMHILVEIAQYLNGGAV